MIEEPDLFEYEGAAVGNNSAVLNTFNRLPGAEHFTGFELETKQQPYGITASYDWQETALSDKETAAHNATYLFTLLDNVDWVRFDFDTGASVEQYRLTREQLQAWYGVDLAGIDEQEKLEELLAQYLDENQKIDALLTQY
ncbi:DUF4825 domain-containing protein [Planococcus sp. CP5-4]|uniref:DUF4825 domain-containing protein n=1 Tax=unclassified Planococcus (in: firmicutes) TaxID=2662419 RepID=UPI001C235E1C|nr:DUF4825 domain-containing protein [Planococcus sp. CP5-4]MBU9673121.1 DUF4825 domain-containing protein [Planococcus sp. CP5-4_YE]MBV0908367.1 DUF4825 domain-containing protein [Planococcus sp. CP5-4_UN]MBW6062429.1 DUF4825 domain-containing protein [Planococcus sp. CP5-4]